MLVYGECECFCGMQMLYVCVIVCITPTAKHGSSTNIITSSRVCMTCNQTFVNAVIVYEDYHNSLGDHTEEALLRSRAGSHTTPACT